MIYGKFDGKRFVNLTGFATPTFGKANRFRKGSKTIPINRIQRVPIISGTVALVDITEQSPGLPLHMYKLTPSDSKTEKDSS